MVYGLELEFTKFVINRLRAWFNAIEQQYLHNLLNVRIEKAWQDKVLSQLEKLTDDAVEAEHIAVG